MILNFPGDAQIKNKYYSCMKLFLFYLEQGLALSWKFISDVLLPMHKGFLFTDLHVIEVDKEPKEHAYRDDDGANLS